MKKLLFFSLVVGVFIGCAKELSFEGNNSPAEGTLQEDVSGDCLPKTVNGTYVAATPLVSTTNTISVQVNVTRTGSYVVNTDTVNGYYFRASGNFTTLGLTTVTLRGTGTPFVEGTNNFRVSFGGTVCDIQVTVLPAGSGGPAVFTLGGAGGACTPSTVNGTYGLGIALVPTANTVQISVNVTTVGTYNISATGGGMTFAAAGTFTATGVQNVTLAGTGTPTVAGANNIPITVGTSTCNISITVTAAGAGTLGGAGGTCTPSTVNGTYTAGVVLAGTNTISVQVNVTTIGAYSITTNTVNGISFSATGSFIATGPQTITLNGTGTPTAGGTFVYTITFLTSSCTCSVLVVTPLSDDYFPRTENSNWSYEFDDVAIDSLYRLAKPAPNNTLSAASNTYNIFLADDGTTGLDSSGYYRRFGATNGNYGEWMDIGGFIGFDNPIWGEYIMLKDTASATWTSQSFAGTVTGTAFLIRFNYRLLNKDIAKSVTTSTGTVNYTNVDVVEEKYQAFDGTTWQDLTPIIDYYGVSYYARGIGLIQYESHDAAGATTLTQKLRRKVVN